MELKDKVAIVTGGGSGLGEAMVRKMIAEGGRATILDLNEALSEAGDEKARNVLIRKLRSALGEWSEDHPR